MGDGYQLPAAQIEAINAAVQAAIRRLAVPGFRPGVVDQLDPSGTIALCTADGPYETSHGYQILYPTGLVPGDRVMLLFVPPNGGFVIGRRGGNFDEWHVVGREDEILFNTGWTHESTTDELDTDAPSLVSWRRHGWLIELRGRAERVSGSSIRIMTLPEDVRPSNDLLFITANGLGGATPVQIERSGDVESASATNLYLDGIIYSINPAMEAL